jgi:hypothetical protein
MEVGLRRVVGSKLPMEVGFFDEYREKFKPIKY